jgi:hypothetical protein
METDTFDHTESPVPADALAIPTATASVGLSRKTSGVSEPEPQLSSDRGRDGARYQFELFQRREEETKEPTDSLVDAEGHEKRKKKKAKSKPPTYRRAELS